MNIALIGTGYVGLTTGVALAFMGHETTCLDVDADRIRDLVMPFEPLAMQLYLPGGIRSLVAGRSPGPQGTHPQQN